MPFQEVADQQSGLPTLLGLAGGYLAGNPARKAAKEKTQYDRAEKSKEDTRADQELAVNVQNASRASEQWNSEKQQKALREGTLANVAKKIPQPTTDPIKDPGTWQKYYLQVANELRAFPADAKAATDAAATVGRAVQYDTQGGVNQARVPLIQAQTGETRALTTDIGTRHEDRVLSDRDRLAIAQTVAQTSLIRAQISASASDRRAADATARSQAAIVAALERTLITQHGDDTRQERGLRHSDELVDRRTKATKAEKAATPAGHATDLEQNPKFKALPGAVQNVILGEIKKGASVEGVRADLQAASKLDPKVKEAALEALGQAPPAPTPAAAPPKREDKSMLPAWMGGQQ